MEKVNFGHYPRAGGGDRRGAALLAKSRRGKVIS